MSQAPAVFIISGWTLLLLAYCIYREGREDGRIQGNREGYRAGKRFGLLCSRLRIAHMQERPGYNDAVLQAVFALVKANLTEAIFELEHEQEQDQPCDSSTPYQPSS